MKIPNIYRNVETLFGNKKEKMTESFHLVKASEPPADAIQAGSHDGKLLWSAVCHTRFGDIPGKSDGSHAWYAYSGREEKTSEFSYVTVKAWRLQKADDAPPQALAVGKQNDVGQIYAAVANTPSGKIPGKAKGNTCWYPLGAKENTTSDFEYICYNFALVKGPQPADAIASGNETDGAGVHYAAVAHVEQGNIPGKAKGNTCWYSYGGKELTTDNFSWVVLPTWKLEKLEFGHVPALAMACGNDASGPLYTAVAHTPHGAIPGRAKGNSCWFAHGGREGLTKEFSWVVM